MSGSSWHEREIRERLASAASSRVHSYPPERLRQLLEDARTLVRLLDQARAGVWVVSSALDEAGTDDVAVEAVFADEDAAQAYVAAQGDWSSLFWVEHHQVSPPMTLDDRVGALVARANEILLHGPRPEHPRRRWFGWILTLRFGKRIYSFSR